MSETKPPLGVQPEWIWLDARIAELACAIARYVHAGRAKDPCVYEWAHELVEHVERRAMKATDETT